MKLLSLSLQAQGFVWVILLFLFCVILVHGIKLAIIGFRSLHKKTPEPPKQPEKKPEPVYFIVERKKKRAKTEYSEPREVKFK